MSALLLAWFLADGGGALIAPARITKSDADRFIAAIHRHHENPTAGARIVVGAWDLSREELCGVAVIGTPSAPGIPSDRVVEVNRCCTDGTRNACSFLYALSAVAASAQGWAAIITYTLRAEGGASLRAAGWWGEDLPARGAGDWSNREGRMPGGVRGEVRWLKVLNDFRAPAPVEDAEPNLDFLFPRGDA